VSFSPLEQFAVVPIIPIKLGFLDLSLTVEFIILVIFFCFLGFVVYSLACKTVGDEIKFDGFKTGFLEFVSTDGQIILEYYYEALLSLVVDNIKHEKGEKFFSLVFSLFTFIIFLNLIGLIPYSFTITSHLIVTFSLALGIFIGVNIVCLRTHGIGFLGLFLPSGLSLGFAFLLVPIEVISYTFKPVSLSVRLFANMMAGHTLLKVIAGFAFVLMGQAGLFFLLHFFPLVVLIPLFLLEFVVAVIQALVFSMLICIYLNDALNIH